MKIIANFKKLLTLLFVVTILAFCKNTSQDQKGTSKLTPSKEESFMQSTIGEKSYNFINTQTEIGVMAQFNRVNATVITGGSKSDGLSIQISLMQFNPKGKLKEGVYQIGENSDEAKTTMNMILVKNGVMFFSGVSCQKTNGTLTITKITDSFIEGTFNFNTKDQTQCLSESASFLPITNGSFSAKFY